MKDLLKNVFPLYGKFASTLNNLKIAEYIEQNWCLVNMSSSQIDFPQVSVITPPAEKTQSKTILFPVDKKLVSTSRNERLSEKHVPVEE